VQPIGRECHARPPIAVEQHVADFGVNDVLTIGAVADELISRSSTSYGCRKPNEARLGAGVGGTSSRPARSYARFALHDGAWLSSA
jgi:hypothetical protein